MPFGEENDNIEDSPANNSRLKKVSSQKSIFDEAKKKLSQREINDAIKKAEENNINYKKRAAELTLNFKKVVSDKTLPQNRNVFLNETEQEILSNMINLAAEINNDPNEQEGMGSLMWIALLLKTCLSQRDRINVLEYTLQQLEKKIDPISLKNSILKEINILDKKKDNG